MMDPMHPLLSIIIPVYREARGIRATLSALAGLGPDCGCEIILSDGEPCASTLAAVREPLEPCPGLVPVQSPKGRGPQMNAGAGAARGELLLFLHADTRLDPRGIAEMIRRFRQSQRGGGREFCGAFDLAIDGRAPCFRIIEKAASLRSRITRIPYGDQGIFISRQLFWDLGGFPDWPIMEDVGLMQKIKRRGIRPVFISHAATTSARRWHTEGLLFTTLRNWTLISLYTLGASPLRLQRFYKSHTPRGRR